MPKYCANAGVAAILASCGDSSPTGCYACAQSFSNRTLKASAIILGDDGLFWVVTLRKMEILLKAGYELAGS
jgi:hypothetical protein